MENSDERHRTTKAPAVLGNDQSTPATHTCENSEKRPKKRPSRLSINPTGERFVGCESALTPDIARLSMPSLSTSGSAESSDGFTTVTDGKRSKRTIPSRVTIDVSPNTLSGAGGAKIDFSEKRMLKEYSRDENKKLVDASFKVFRGMEKKVIGEDLLKGFDKADKPELQRYSMRKHSIHGFLYYLHSNRDLLDICPNFVCAVSTLRLLICACYEQDEVREWKILARQRDGIWYLSEYWQDYDYAVPYKVKYAARMFEILSTETETLKKAARLAKNFLRHEKTYQVWQAQLGKHRLLYSGDVDCVDDKGNAVELKAMTQSRWTSKQRRTWAQVHLMGSKKVVVGHLEWKNDAITLTGTKEIDAESLRPDASATWKTECCMACLDTILNSLKVDAFFQDEETTYVFTLDRSTKKITAKISTIELPLNDEREEFLMND